MGPASQKRTSSKNTHGVIIKHQPSDQPWPPHTKVILGAADGRDAAGTTGKGHPAWANLSPEALMAQEGQQEG